MRPGTDFSRNEIEAFDKGYRINKDGINVAKKYKEQSACNRVTRITLKTIG